MMTVSELYLASLALLGESVGRATGYEGFKIALTNQLLAECFAANNAILESQGQPILTVMPSVSKDADTIPYHEGLVRECMPYGLAGLFVVDDDRAKSSAFSRQFEDKLKRYSKVNFTDIINVY